MKTYSKPIPIILIITLLMSSCNLNDSKFFTEKTDDIEIPAVVTNIYDPAACAVPESYSWTNGVTPFFDKYTGMLSIVCESGTEMTTEDDSIYMQYTYTLLTFNADGELQDNTILPVDPLTDIEIGMVGAEDILWIEQREEGNVLVSRNRQSGEILSETPFADLFGEGAEYDFSILLTDVEGKLWLENEQTAVVLDNAYTIVEQFWFQDSVSSIVCGEDGNVYGCLSDQGSKSLVRFHEDHGEIQKIAQLDMSALKISRADYMNEKDTGYEFYYNTSDAIYGMYKNKEGIYTSELVLDYANSGIINYAELQLMGMDAGGTDFISVCTEDLMLFAKTVNQDGQWITTPVLYRTAEDIVLAEVQVIEFAHAITLEDNIRANLLNYDTQNRDVSVVTLDYSQYNTKDDPEAGVWRLVTDILNGIISPDIVYGYSDSTEILQMMEHGRYTDLMPYFTADDTVNPDTVFGCVQRAFTDEEGKLWALTPYFFLRTLLGTNESLGAYAENSTWTVEEFLDFTEQYPTPLFYLTREYMETYFYPVYTAFCDKEAGTCTFDSPLFKRYLEYLLSLPTEAEYEAKSPLGQIAPADRYQYYMDGTVPLKEFYMGDPLFMRYDMGTPEVALIGFPADGTSGAVFNTRMTFMMTDTAEDPGLCWEFIKAFMHTEYGMWMSGPGITAMKDVFTEQQYQNQGKIFRIYGNGDAVEESRAAFYESIGMPFGQGTAYVSEEWHEPTVQYGIEYLDTEGIPLCGRLPNAVSEIIEEEFSALVAGHGTVDDCADKIQSRVSIWLAENKEG